jgi:hypothetical protein
MEIQIAVEPLNGQGFRASCRSPVALAAEAATRDEAILQLRRSLETHVKNGTELLTLKVPTKEDNPWLRMAGMFDPDDPVVQEWLEIIQENRRKADEDPDYLLASTFSTRIS